MAVKGVRQVLRIEGAVAVVADNFWAAKQGLAAAAPRFDDGANANVSTAGIVADMAKASQGTGAVATNEGDALKVLDQAGRPPHRRRLRAALPRARDHGADELHGRPARRRLRPVGRHPGAGAGAGRGRQADRAAGREGEGAQPSTSAAASGAGWKSTT